MTEDVLKTHITQLQEAVTQKKVDVTQFFGEPITDEAKKKLQERDELEAKVKELSEKAGATNLSESEQKLAGATIDRIVRDIKSIDPNAPLGHVLDSKFNNLDKIDILGGYQKAVEHYQNQIATLKRELKPDGNESATQTFSSPKGTEDDASKIIASMIPKGDK